MKAKTPIRAALSDGSRLLPLVHDGLGALEAAHRGYIEEPLRREFADSLDVDSAFRAGHETENRWDYLLGHRESQRIYGLEPHSAHNREISTVIKKRARTREHLRSHLKSSARVADWFWVASGKVDFTPFDKAVALLADNGIAFVGRQLLAKRLGIPTAPSARRKRSETR